MTPLEFVRSRSPGAQIAVVAVGVMLLGLAFGLVYLFFLRPDYEVLFTDLRAADAVTIVEQLEQKNTPYRLENSGTTILVPEAAVDAARLEVMSTELPLRGMVGFELFNKSDMGLTEFAQKINYQRALQGELARTIMTIDSIESARVHLTIPEATIFRADRRPPKASVTIIARKGATIPAETIQGIQRLVAASVADLDIAAVVILDEQGSLVSGVYASEPVSPGLQEARAVEQYYAAQIRTTVAPLYPDVQVTATIPAGQWAATSTEIDSRQAALASWRSGVRTFRLQVSLASATPLTASDQQDLRALIRQAIGTTDAGDDLILFGPAIPVMAESPPPARSVESMSADREPLAVDTPRWSWPTLLGLLALVGLAGGLFIFRPRRTRLTASQLDAYAMRLRQTLEEEEAYGSPPR